MKKVLMFVALFALMAATASATVITPPGALGPFTTTSTNVGAALATKSGSFNTGDVAGTWSAAVYNSSSGFLNFVYSFFVTSVTGAPGIGRITVGNFGHYSTDLRITSGQNAFLATLSAGIMGIQWIPDIAPGHGVTVEVDTNAPHYSTNGTYSVQDGLTQNLSGFQPVPEPGTLAIFGSGLIGIAGVLRRKLNF